MLSAAGTPMPTPQLASMATPRGDVYTPQFAAMATPRGDMTTPREGHVPPRGDVATWGDAPQHHGSAHTPLPAQQTPPQREALFQPPSREASRSSLPGYLTECIY